MSGLVHLMVAFGGSYFFLEVFFHHQEGLTERQMDKSTKGRAERLTDRKNNFLTDVLGFS